MKKQGKLNSQRKRGQVMVEYMIVLLSVVLMFFLLDILRYTFEAYGYRALKIITWKYP